MLCVRAGYVQRYALSSWINPWTKDVVGPQSHTIEIGEHLVALGAHRRPCRRPGISWPAIWIIGWAGTSARPPIWRPAASSDAVCSAYSPAL